MIGVLTCVRQNRAQIFSSILVVGVAAERIVCDAADKMRMAELEGDKIAMVLKFISGVADTAIETFSELYRRRVLEGYA